MGERVAQGPVCYKGECLGVKSVEEPFDGGGSPYKKAIEVISISRDLDKAAAELLTSFKDLVPGTKTILQPTEI